MTGTERVRIGGVDDAGLLGRLLAGFNAEFDSPGPTAAEIAELARPQLESGEIAALYLGEDGFAQLRFRRSLYDAHLVCCLEELWVRPDRRHQGLGRVLLEASIEHARSRGASTMDLNTSTDDHDARRLYESAGFTNLEDGRPSASMLYYEREM